jgi:hypothetical protein
MDCSVRIYAVQDMKNNPQATLILKLIFNIILFQKLHILVLKSYYCRIMLVCLSLKCIKVWNIFIVLMKNKLIAKFCENSNGPTGFLKVKEFVDEHSDC